VAGRPLARARRHLAEGCPTIDDLVVLQQRDPHRLVAALDVAEPDARRRDELLSLLNQLATGRG
jgi:hypothetical protein